MFTFCQSLCPRWLQFLAERAVVSICSILMDRSLLLLSSVFSVNLLSQMNFRCYMAHITPNVGIPPLAYPGRCLNPL